MIVCCFAWTVYATHRRCMILTLCFEVRQMKKKDYDIHRISGERKGKKDLLTILEKSLYKCKTRDFDVERFYTSVWAGPTFSA